jgi:hypothetical protein
VALTLGQGAQVVADVGYHDRIRAGMVRYAVTVMAEALTANSQTLTTAIKRKTLATKILVNPNAWVDSFVSMVGSDPGASLTWNQPTSISSSTNANPSVVTTAAVHGLAVGDVVEIVGHVTNTTINGVWTLATVATTTTFTVPGPASGAGGATGTVMKMETDVNVNFTIQTNFNAIAGTYTGDTS